MAERNNKVMKKLDKYLGIPLVYLLGKIHHKKKLPAIKSAPRIVVMKTAAIGDTILTQAVIREIKYAYPNSHITYICSKGNYGMVKVMPGIDEIFQFQMKSPIRSLMKLKSLGHFDFVFDMASWNKINAVITFFLDADYTVGFAHDGQYRHYVYDAVVKHRDDIHEVENYRNIIKEVGIKTKGFIPVLPHQQQKILEDKYAIFHMFPAGSCQKQRMWVENGWLELAEKVYIKYGLKIFISGGKDDLSYAERMRCLIEEKNVPVIVGAGEYNLNEMPSVIHNAEFVVSVYTGIMHMAAASDVPVVSLQGCNSAVRWGACNPDSVSVTNIQPCQPCVSLGFESNCGNPVCITGVTSDMVMAAIKQIYTEQ